MAPDAEQWPPRSPAGGTRTWALAIALERAVARKKDGTGGAGGGGAGAGDGGAAAAPDTDARQGEEARRALVCAACGHEITRVDAAFSVGGSHLHTFMNPGGFVFEIACYKEAPGTIGAGPSSPEWSWFPGYVWRVALCGGCHVHVGWSFRGEGSGFFGLVRERVREGESE